MKMTFYHRSLYKINIAKKKNQLRQQKLKLKTAGGHKVSKIKKCLLLKFHNYDQLYKWWWAG
jgi:hypothetical protein